MSSLKLPLRKDEEAPLTSRSHVPQTARTTHTLLTARTDGRSEAGSLADTEFGVGPIGAFLGTQASDDAKAMWKAYRSQLQAPTIGDVAPSLGLKAAQGNVKQRLPVAPDLPKLGGPDDPGRMVKDWAYYSYHPRASLACPLNQFGTSNNGRWPGLNHTPVTRHHLVLRPGTVGAKRTLPDTVWTGHPRLEPGPGEAPILRNLKFDSRDHERRVRDVERHREVLRRNLATRVAARTNLEIMSSQRFPG